MLAGFLFFAQPHRSALLRQDTPAHSSSSAFICIGTLSYPDIAMSCTDRLRERKNNQIRGKIAISFRSCIFLLSQRKSILGSFQVLLRLVYWVVRTIHTGTMYGVLLYKRTVENRFQTDLIKLSVPNESSSRHNLCKI